MAAMSAIGTKRTCHWRRGNGLKPDVIVVATTPGTLAAKQATASIPIVGVNMTDPVGLGLVASEARPGANVTGILFRLEGLSGKQVEIDLDLMPGATSIDMLVDVNNPSNIPQRREVKAEAGKTGVLITVICIRIADEFGSEIKTFARERVSIMIVLGASIFINARRQIASFALTSRLPTIFYFREHV